MERNVLKGWVALSMIVLEADDWLFQYFNIEIVTRKSKEVTGDS